MSFIWLHKPYPTRIVIAGPHYSEIASTMQGNAYRIGRIRVENAFAISFGEGYLLYAHRDYTGYRRLFRSRFIDLSDNLDVDHVLAKNISSQLAGRYILLARVPSSINRSHGATERLGLDPASRIYLSKTFYMDSRIFRKLIGRKPQRNKIGFNTGMQFGSKITPDEAEKLFRALGLDSTSKLPTTFLKKLRVL